MKQVECNKCGKYFEVEEHEEWGYCPFCENDQVEVYKNQLLNVQMVSAKEITKLHKELALTEKALELACEIAVGNEEMNCSGISCSDSCKYKGVCKDIKIVADYFKTKAKEIMKSE